MWWWWWCILVISSQMTTKIEAREFQRVLNGRISETRLDSCNERVLRALFTSCQCPTDVLQFINLLRCDIARKHHLVKPFNGLANAFLFSPLCVLISWWFLAMDSCSDHKIAALAIKEPRRQRGCRIIYWRPHI